MSSAFFDCTKPTSQVNKILPKQTQQRLQYTCISKSNISTNRHTLDRCGEEKRSCFLCDCSEGGEMT